MCASAMYVGTLLPYLPLLASCDSVIATVTVTMTATVTVTTVTTVPAGATRTFLC